VCEARPLGPLYSCQWRWQSGSQWLAERWQWRHWLWLAVAVAGRAVDRCCVLLTRVGAANRTQAYAAQ
jgi:hypothetical protein